MRYFERLLSITVYYEELPSTEFAIPFTLFKFPEVSAKDFMYNLIQ